MLSDSRELGVVSWFPFSLKVGQKKLAVIQWEKCKEGKQAENLHERRLLPPLPSSSCSIAWGSDSIGSSFSITSSHPPAELHSPLVCTLLAHNDGKVALFCLIFLITGLNHLVELWCGFSGCAWSPAVTPVSCRDVPWVRELHVRTAHFVP